MRCKGFVVLGVLAAALFGKSGSSSAQSQSTGTLIGYVFDQGGTPLKGIAIAASSPTQIGGVKRTTTDDQGRFVIAGLTPGVFRVEADAPKLKKVIQENVRITQANQTQIDLILEVETVAEEVKIIERAPIVNMNNASVGDSFDAEFLQGLPLASRDYQGVAAMTAGVNDREGSGNPSIRGGTYFNNSYTVDGFNTTDPVTHTFGQNFSFDAMANVEVSTAALGAENADTSGGLINVVTKSGSNRFELTSSADYSDQHMRLFKDNFDRGTNRLMRADLNVGGPIVRDKLWYFVSGQIRDGTFTLQQNPNYADHPPFHQTFAEIMAKFTWQLTQRNKLELLTFANPAIIENDIQSFLVEPEAERRQFQRSELLGVTWNSNLSDELYLVNRLGYIQGALEVGPQSCEWDPAGCTRTPGTLDASSGILRNNYTSQALRQTRQLQLNGSLEWLTQTRSLGGHNVKLSWRVESSETVLRSTVPGDATYTSFGPTPLSRTEVCSNDPKMDGGICRQNFLRSVITGTAALLSLQDGWKITRYFEFRPGVSWQFGTSSNDKGQDVTDIQAFTPNLSLIWDATHDGKTKLRFNAKGTADTGFLALAASTGRSLYGRRCQWDETAQAYVRNCRATGGNDSVTVGLPCGPTGVAPDGNPCKTKLVPPRMWEASIGAEREVVTGIVVGTNVIYRKFVRQWEDVETNANWNEGGTDLRREAPFKTGRSEFIFDLQTPESAERLYRGVTVFMKKREGRLKTNLNYTWSKYEGVADDSFASLYLDNPGQAPFYYGPLSNDFRHDLRLQATYAFKSWLTLGVGYAFLSGGPYNRYFFDPVFGSYVRFQAQRGYDSRGNLNPEDDRELRLPDQSQLDFKVQVSLEPIIKKKIDIWLDAFNLMALRTTTEVIEQDGPVWGQPLQRMSPLRMRIGLRYKY